MSRIIVKNLPGRMSEVRLREQFSQSGTITDIKLMKTQRGVFRRFAFIGYASDAHAQSAVEHFNKTFINASKIEVELAKPYGDDNLTRPWSKYSRGSSAFTKRQKQAKEDSNSNLQQKKATTGDNHTAERMGREEDPAFNEFLDTHKHSHKVWADSALKTKVTGQMEVCNSDTPNISRETEDQTANASDMDYLRSKMVPTTQQSDLDQSESVSNEATSTPKNTTPYTVKMLGLPFSVKEKGICEFFHPLPVAAVRITTDAQGRPSGRAYADFNTEQDLRKALKRNKDCIGHRYIELFQDTGPQSAFREESSQPHRSWVNVSDIEDVSEFGRLFVRNLSYTTTEDELTELFEVFGPLTEVTIPLDKITNKPIGFAFVTFMLPQHAVKALEALDGQIFQGRLLHLLPAKPREGREQNNSSVSSSYKRGKLHKTKTEAGKGHNWNTLFLGSNAVVDAIADRYSIDKSEVFDGSSAVRLALGETQLVTETRMFMEAKGVQLEMFANDKIKRSCTIILVKNLPYGTSELELSNLFQPFGQVLQVILPPAGVSALVEFAEPVHARTAFQHLAYTSFKHLPLYLEWAPEAVIQSNQLIQGTQSDTGALAEDESEQATVFVKNLNFGTTDKALQELMSSVGKVLSVSIAKKRNMKDPSKPLSMGYGFVVYVKHKTALKAIRRLQNTELDGHKLELKLSTRQQTANESTRKSSKQKKQLSAKILVRNIPFEASNHEVRDLFQTFGTLKTVRLPKKFGALRSEHRGFGFVEFTTREEAKRAFESLCQSTHLYGRRLVLEWAESEENVDAIRKRTAEHFHSGPLDKRSKIKAQELLNTLEKTVNG